MPPALLLRRSATELQDSADSASHSEAVPPPYANSTHGEVDAAGFHALMEDVLQRTSGGWASAACTACWAHSGWGFMAAPIS